MPFVKLIKKRIMMRFFDKENNRLVYTETKSDNKYWDNHWNDCDFSKKVRIKSNKFITKNTQKYLAKGRILEGGCGRGQNVYLLQNLGYECVGIDYAKQTVDKINVLVPEINVQFGDVRKLEFEDNSFDGYWSLGVIEHFYDGYDEIINEMHRILKPDGILFLTVPTMSWLRRFKAKLNNYSLWQQEQKYIDEFYQFALDPNIVANDFRAAGFEILKISPYDGFKGLKDELNFLKPIMQTVYDSDNIAFKIIKKIVDIFVKPFASHMSLFVLKKQ
jgi:SAM-dependent methyltransferase